MGEIEPIKHIDLIFDFFQKVRDEPQDSLSILTLYAKLDCLYHATGDLAYHTPLEMISEIEIPQEPLVSFELNQLKALFEREGDLRQRLDNLTNLCDTLSAEMARRDLLGLEPPRRDIRAVKRLFTSIENGNFYLNVVKSYSRGFISHYPAGLAVLGELPPK